MSTILLSIKSKSVEKIFSGEKRVEFRKTGFSREIKHAVIYSTAPVKKIVGYFEVDFIYGDSPLNIWITHSRESGIDEEAYYKYYKGAKRHIVIGIKNPARIEPVELSVLGMRKPPQTFCYLSDKQAELFF